MSGSLDVGQPEEVEVLRLPAFRRLWGANGLRYSAGEVAGLALPITAVLLLHAGPLAVGLIFACGRAGYLLFGLPAGVWIDRWNKKSVLIASDLCYALAFASVPVAYLLGSLTVTQMMLVALVESTAAVFFDIAHTSILPQLMPKRIIADANARLQTSENAIQAVSPSVAGVLTQTIAAPLLYLFAAVCHGGSALLVLGVKVRDAVRPERTAKRRFREEIAEGVVFSLRQPFLRLMLVQTSLFTFGVGLLLAILPFFLVREIGMTPFEFGLQASLGAVSGVISSLVCPRLRRRYGEIRMTLLFAGLAPVVLLTMPLAAVFRAAAVPLAFIAAIGINFVIVGRSIAGAGLRARVTPNEYLGRVSAAYVVVTRGATTVGGLTSGVVASAFSTSTTLWVAVLEMAVPTVILLRSPLRGYRTLPPEWEVPDEQRKPQSRSESNSS
ncbi:MFS transporter [Streptomyces sp. NPDC058964]|uniref:MFS transporter n=1 Tax=Streptomyces sp. NPDC058964 TaxID=3346681 RepID=UPI0036942883